MSLESDGSGARLGVFVFLFFFLAASEQARGQNSDEKTETEDDANALIRVLADFAVGVPGGDRSAIPDIAEAGFEQFLAVTNDGFEVIQEAFDIHVVSISDFVLHDPSISPFGAELNGVFTQYSS